VYRTILVLVSDGCTTWPLTLRAECRLRVFENGELREIFGPKREEVIGDFIIHKFIFTGKNYVVSPSRNQSKTADGSQLVISVV
jgi:hypothetical protein